jgi:hypothetical protein
MNAYSVITPDTSRRSAFSQCDRAPGPSPSDRGRTPPREGQFQPGPAHPRWKPCPPTFAEVFTRHGWRGVERVFGSRTGCSRRWLYESGEEELLQARREYRRRLSKVRLASEALRNANKRAKDSYRRKIAEVAP